MVERLGFDQFSFARSEEATVQGVGDDDIDLITADVRLVPGDGLEAVEAICDKQRIPVSASEKGFSSRVTEQAVTARWKYVPISLGSRWAYFLRGRLIDFDWR